MLTLKLQFVHSINCAGLIAFAFNKNVQNTQILPQQTQLPRYNQILQIGQSAGMAEIEEYHEQIQNSLNKLSNIINRSALFNTNKKKWRDQCNKQIENISNFIRTCEQLISEMPAASVRHYVSTTKSYKKELDQLKEDYQKKIREQSNAATNNDRGDYDKNNTVVAVIKRGDETQDRTNQAIDSMFKTVEEGISLADEINLSLNKQIQQLDRIHGKVKDTQSTLKRAQKSINYFMKALECDKCMLGLILLNLLALIALIVLLVKKGGG